MKKKKKNDKKKLFVLENQNKCYFLEIKHDQIIPTLV